MANEGDIVDAITWVSKKDWVRAREKAFTFSSTITALKTDITLLKAEISGLAIASLGANLVKVDYSFLKVDEKGVTWRGEQLYATKRADEAKHHQTKWERAVRDFDKEVTALKEAEEDARKKRAELEAASARLNSSREKAKGSKATTADLKELGRSADAQRNAQKALEQAEQKFRNLRTKVNETRTRVDNLKKDMDEVKPDKVFARTTEQLKNFEQALQKAANQA
ncbi:hypothetical protein [Streptomyces sp. enrichment culture]|uniref:hypothetical protein n=1 Tax=Streptomyces sp. enrichment culture TaxID=1795815 RepID=UPI003F576270